jgi:hypothetical protein
MHASRKHYLNCQHPKADCRTVQGKGMHQVIPLCLSNLSPPSEPGEVGQNPQADGYASPHSHSISIHFDVRTTCALPANVVMTTGTQRLNVTQCNAKALSLLYHHAQAIIIYLARLAKICQSAIDVKWTRIPRLVAPRSHCMFVHI